MTITVQADHNERMTLEEFIQYVQDHVDLDDIHSLAAAGKQFRAVANDPDLVANHFNNAIKHYLDHGLTAYTPQSVVLGSGRGFLIRANIWTPLKLETSLRAREERALSYRETHDHNFAFMTVGYFGPGYTTDLYQYDPSRVQGYVGEQVDLEFVERTQLPKGKVMVYRERFDAHTQHPPEALSISLNVVVTNPRSLEVDQYCFSPATRQITELSPNVNIFRRASVTAMLGAIGNKNSLGLLGDILKQAPCKRVREATLIAAVRLPNVSYDDRRRTLELALNDPEPLVREKAQTLLAQIAA